jgi:hypothetical protein
LLFLSRLLAEFFPVSGFACGLQFLTFWMTMVETNISRIFLNDYLLTASGWVI